jgi:eukaryotic-like serine/threonine-protein kinase
VVVLLLAVAAGVGGWWFGAGRYTTTPGVVNLTAAEARQEIRAAGLGYREGEAQYSETVDAGSVITTDPAGGERILDDGTVLVTLSRGAERYEVPPVKGMSLPEATRALEDTSLTRGDVTRRYNERVRRGFVLAADPTPGQELRPDAAVDLVVSRGPKPIEVPDFTGKSAARAEKRFDKLGLDVRRTEENSDTVAEGKVISQAPSSGTLFRGDAVSLTVSKGPVLVEIPDLTAQGVAEATATLQDLGFVVQSQPGPGYLGLGFVQSAEPGFGTKAPKGSTVVLYLV